MLHSNPSISHSNYFRILVLASVDILLTLPIGIVSLTLNIVGALSALNDVPFYRGWTFLHADWEPEGISYAEIQAYGTATLAESYFGQWSSPVLAFVIFGLFGVTPEARASYWRIICTVGGWFGWKPTPRPRNGQASLGEIEFGARPVQDTSGFDLEMGYVAQHASLIDTLLTCSSRSRTPSFINTDVHAANQRSGNASGALAAREEETETNPEVDEETPRDYKADDAVSRCVY